ncbi:brevican core protein-like, partial [Empidonax traillii]|uniref:brevican core protein-like n=1 Tax=Empidonax traillii TaxID=164674 RepID=UPI000FFD4C0C
AENPQGSQTPGFGVPRPRQGAWRCHLVPGGDVTARRLQTGVCWHRHPTHTLRGCAGVPRAPCHACPPQLYENWHPGQPDSYFLSGENCVVIVWHDGGQWSDVPCNYHLSYTCKMGLVQCGPPPALTNARAFGKPKQRYEIGSIARYQCRHGLVPRRSPVIRCREDGTWEPPQLACRPGLAQPRDD